MRKMERKKTKKWEKKRKIREKEVEGQGGILCLLVRDKEKRGEKERKRKKGEKEREKRKLGERVLGAGELDYT